MQSQEELIKQIEKLESAGHVKDTFIANVSHELRTPMNAILGFSELILQLNASDEVNGYARDIKNASNSLLAIINDLLDISKIESGKMELSVAPYFLRYLFSDVESVVSIPVQNKGLEFRTNINPELPSQFLGDIVRIRQILINIINNAVKFTKEGYVEFDATFEEGITSECSEDYKKCVGENNEDFVTLVFKVKDTGIGIKPENLGKIFDKFQQVDSRVNRGIEGTGLGLPLSKQFVEMMHGDLKVTSVYGEGTEFTVRIPQKVMNREKLSRYFLKSGSEEERNDFYAPAANILVVDDNAINLRIMSGLLGHYQIDAVTVESGFEAIEKIKENDFDIVFMDHMMPDMDGVETTHRIRMLEDEKKKNVTIVAVSANAIRGIKEQFVSQGFQDYLSKPIELSRLEYMLKTYLPANLIVEEEKHEETPIEMPDVEIQGIDIAAGLAKSDNDVKDYLEILGFVRDLGNDKCDELKKLIDEKDYTNYTIAVHALKSVSASIGAHRLFTMARINEMAGKNGQYDFLERNHEKLIGMYRDLVAAIDEGLKEIGDIS